MTGLGGLLESLVSLFVEFTSAGVTRGGRSMAVAGLRKIGWAGKNSGGGAGIQSWGLKGHSVKGHRLSSISLGASGLGRAGAAAASARGGRRRSTAGPQFSSGLNRPYNSFSANSSPSGSSAGVSSAGSNRGSSGMGGDFFSPKSLNGITAQGGRYQRAAHTARRAAGQRYSQAPTLKRRS